MFSKEKAKKIILLIGDGVFLYLALFLMLSIRFHSNYPQSEGIWIIHIQLFSIIFLAWLIVFYIGHLYEIQDIFNRNKLALSVLWLQLINFALAIIFFYIFSIITPKTNLLIVSVLAGLFILGWRLLFVKITSRVRPARLLIFGISEDENLVIQELIEKAPRFGYKIIKVVSSIDSLGESLEEFIKYEKIEIVVVSGLVGQKEIHHHLFNALLSKVEILDLAEFYELIVKKIQISLVDEQWFLFNLRRLDRQIYDSVKRILDFAMALIGLICSIWLWPFIALAIKIDSAGPVFHKSWRMGENQQLFQIRKFRTMTVGVQGPHWTEKNDKRITQLGRFLRRTHLDEIPQFINVIKGSMSFVGPRPEEKALSELYTSEIPFYNFRHLARPGLVGWAQFNYPHGASVEDAREKLQYDLYYLKNRSLWLDIGIILRAIRIFIFQETH